MSNHPIRVLYSHTQRARNTFIILMLLTLINIGYAIAFPYPVVLAPALLSLALLVFVLVVMSSLTVTVTSQAVGVRFGAGLVRKSFPLDDIESVTAVRNHPLCGWGIRWFFGGWVYNVDGLDAVELEMKNAGRIRIGTDEPERLMEAVAAARRHNGEV